MDPANILMCVNIPRGVTEDLLCELFCVAGPIEDISFGKSGRSCFIVYEFKEAVKTAKEIFKDIQFYGRSIELYDENDIKAIHKNQEEGQFVPRREPEYSDTPKHYRFDNESRYNRSNAFHNNESMTPKSRNSYSNFQGRHTHFNYQGSGDNTSTNSSYTPNSLTENDRITSASPPELDMFKSPYSQPISRNSYQQFRRGYYDGGDASHANHNHQPSHFDNRKRHSDQFTHNSPSKNNYTGSNVNYGSNKQKNELIYNQISDDVYPVEEIDVEQNYEEHVRRQFHNSPRKPQSRDDDRSHQNRFKNTPSTSSDYVVRNKAREFDRSPYSRQDYKRQERDSKRSHDHYSKDRRNRRR